MNRLFSTNKPNETDYNSPALLLIVCTRHLLIQVQRVIKQFLPFLVKQNKHWSNQSRCIRSASWFLPIAHICKKVVFLVNHQCINISIVAAWRLLRNASVTVRNTVFVTVRNTFSVKYYPLKTALFMVKNYCFDTTTSYGIKPVLAATELPLFVCAFRVLRLKKIFSAF